MCRYKIPVAMRKYVRSILIRSFRRFQAHSVEGDKDSYYFDMYLAPEMFGRIYDRAYCEKDYRETGDWSMTPLEMKDTAFNSCLNDLAQRTAFGILPEMPPRDFTWEKIPNPKRLLRRELLTPPDYDLTCPNDPKDR